ncbi:hypothetical protein [Chromobacterium alticapitis]|nr:hypothetical protein [Chromobacterium alticapitis]
MSGSDLYALTEMLDSNGEMDSQVASATRGDIDNNGWNGGGACNAVQIFAKRHDDVQASVKAGETSARLASYSLDNYSRVQQALEKLGAIHDALQGEDKVQSAASDSMKQALDLSRFERWSQAMTRAESSGEKVPLSKETAESVSRVLQRAGADLPPPPDGQDKGAWVKQALQAYRSWQTQHPGSKLDIDLQTAEQEDKTVFKTKNQPKPTPETAGAPLPPPSSTPAQRAQAALTQQAEAQYGMGMSTLQLIKSTDIGSLSMEQVKQYSTLLQASGVLSQDNADSLLPLTQRGMVDSLSYYKRDLSWLHSMLKLGLTPQYATAAGMVDLSDVNARISNDQQGQRVLERLQRLHETLQSDERVPATASGSLRQASDQAAFDNWARVEQKGARNAQNAGLEYRNQNDVDGIFRVLQRLGVELTPLDGDSTTGQRLQQAWQDYQQWRGSQYGGQAATSLPVKRTIDTFA